MWQRGVGPVTCLPNVAKKRRATWLARLWRNHAGD